MPTNLALEAALKRLDDLRAIERVNNIVAIQAAEAYETAAAERNFAHDAVVGARMLVDEIRRRDQYAEADAIRRMPTTDEQIDKEPSDG